MGRIQIRLRVSLEDLQDGLILIMSLKKSFALELDFYKRLYDKDIEGLYMEPYKKVFVTFDSIKLNLLNIKDPVKNRSSSSGKKKSKEKVVAPICGKITLPKESIKTKKETNVSNLITQSEAPATEVIVAEKLRTDISVNNGLQEKQE